MRRLGGWVAREVGLRFMARRKVACAMAVATMALAMGANTAVFSVLEAFLGSSFGLPEADRVAIVAPVRDLPGRPEVVFLDAYPNYLFVRDTQHSFDAVACVVQSVSSWDDGSESRTVQAAKVTASFFSATGVRPQLGREFAAAEEGPSPASVVIVSYALWHDAMGGDPSVLGRVMLLDGAPHTIVGVMPAGFAHPLPTDVWLPFDIPAAQRTTIAGGRNLTIYAHLRTGVTREQVVSDLAELTRSAVEADAQNQDFRYKLLTIVQFVLPNADRTVVFVQIGALVLTLLAVVNLSSLLIAWGCDRRREMAVRVALGARGRSVVRMLVLQALVVVGAGAAGGFLLARLLVPAIRRMDVTPQFALYLGRMTIDGSVLGWSAVVAAVAGIVAGVLPAVLGRREALGDTLRSSRGSGQTPAALRWQKSMVLAQAVLTVVILSTAALVGLSFRNLAQVPDGFAADGRVVARVQLTSGRYQSVDERVAFGERLEEALALEPEVTGAGFTSTLPVGDQRNAARFLMEHPDGSFDPEPMLLHIRRVSDGYFAAIDLPLLKGRAFDTRDGASSPLVAVVSRTLASRLWPDEDPLGGTLSRLVAGSQEPQLLQVVGVVGDAMDGGYEAPAGEAVYVPWAQNAVARMSIVVRPRTSPEQALAAVRRALRAADPVLAAGDVTDLPTLVRGANALPRLQAILLTAFALVATGIVVLGSYGLMSQLAATREREFALRVAVGAQTSHVGSQVLAQAARISGPGVLIGVGTAWLLGGAMRPFLFGVDPRSVAVIGAVAAATLLLVGLATLPVAVRAMRVHVGAALTGG
jgi:putative ABC transport system permease protein